MRPLELCVEGFGPYLTRQTLDFRPLNGLFLICGETGSGKTMLLDALCFALYGQSTGGGRDRLELLRCQSAGDETPTHISLRFAHKGREYLFTRDLSVHRKRSGDVEYRIRQNALRLEEDGFLPLLANPTAARVRELAEQILGLTAEQFCRVALLPQGKFERFLVAKSGEKEEILRTLFDVSDYLRICEKLLAVAKEQGEKQRALHAELSACLDTHKAQSAAALRAGRDEMEKALREGERAVSALREAAQAAREDLNTGRALQESLEARRQARAHLEALQAKAGENEAQKERLRRALAAREALPALLKRDDAAKAQAEREQACQRAESALTEALRRETEAAQADEAFAPEREAQPERRARLARLLSLRGDYAALRDARARLERAGRAETEAERSLKAAQAEAAQAGKALDALRAERDRLREEYLKPYESLRLRRDQADAFRAALQGSREAAEQLTEAERTQREAQRAARDAEQTLKKAQAEQQAQLDRYLSNAAGALAATLKPGEPCPVCGSREHPHVHGAAGAGNQAALRAAQAALKAAQAGYTEREGQLARAELELEKTRAAETEARGRLSALPAFTLEEGEQARAAFARAEEARQAHEALLGKLPQAEKRQQAALSALSAAQSAAAQTAQERALAREALEGLRGRLDPALPDLAALEKAAEKEKKAIEDCDERDRFLKSARNAASLAVGAARTEANLSVQERDAAREAYLLAESAAAQAAKNSGFGDENALRSSVLADTEIQALQAAVGRYAMDLELAKSQLRRLDEALGEAQPPDMEALTERETSASAAYEEALSRAAEARADLRSLSADAEKAERLEKEAGEAERVFRKMDRFARLLRGEKGIGLPRYALHVMLGAVCARANELLALVHGGRYALAPSLEGDGRSKSGLELNVLDAFSGKPRSVESLSGGEKFLASLALSVALKAVVQGLRGGVQVESMFIDEGFGSLDAQSVQDALQLLLLSGAGSQCVGIISHVQALRETLTSRVLVESESGRSRIRVEA